MRLCSSLLSYYIIFSDLLLHCNICYIMCSSLFSYRIFSVCCSLLFVFNTTPNPARSGGTSVRLGFHKRAVRKNGRDPTVTRVSRFMICAFLAVPDKGVVGRAGWRPDLLRARQVALGHLCLFAAARNVMLRCNAMRCGVAMR